MMLIPKYYKKMHEEMMLNGDTPNEKTVGLEIYQWNDEQRSTLYYIPVTGPLEAYSFSSYPQPKWKEEYTYIGYH